MDLHSTESNRKDWWISCMHNWPLAYVLHAIWKRIVELFVADWWDGVDVSEKGTQTHTCDGAKQTHTHTQIHFFIITHSNRISNKATRHETQFNLFPCTSPQCTFFVEVGNYSLARRTGTGSVWLVTTRPVTLINHSIQENWFIAGRVAACGVGHHPSSRWSVLSEDIVALQPSLKTVFLSNGVPATTIIFHHTKPLGSVTASHNSSYHSDDT